MTKTVFITGTSSGLGRETAKLFQGAGWNVIATMRNPSDGAELSALDRVLVVQLDLEDEPSLGTAIHAGIRHFGQIDVLVNNAGFGAFGPLEATPIEIMRRQLEVNVIGALRTIQAILPHFRERHCGMIINITSTAGRTALPFGSLYHASKYALEGATEALQYELAPVGIQVKLVEPGAIKTDFATRSMVFSNDPSLTEYQPYIEAVMSAYAALTNMSSEPERIAQVILTAATDESTTLRYVAGDDAAQLLDQRAAMDDAAFFAQVRTVFKLPV